MIKIIFGSICYFIGVFTAVCIAANQIEKEKKEGIK